MALPCRGGKSCRDGGDQNAGKRTRGAGGGIQSVSTGMRGGEGIPRRAGRSPCTFLFLRTHVHTRARTHTHASRKQHAAVGK